MDTIAKLKQAESARVEQMIREEVSSLFGHKEVSPVGTSLIPKPIKTLLPESAKSSGNKEKIW